MYDDARCKVEKAVYAMDKLNELLSTSDKMIPLLRCEQRKELHSNLTKLEKWVKEYSKAFADFEENHIKLN